ncbi:MAG: Lrp/AsnC family transcriptional regulator [Candidatus Bathyarchaeia archaeon]|jgi:DNA-binding Lrp family transcriptional regulator
MSIEIDSIDIKILHAFLKDARAKVKNIADDCNLSPTAISKRIKRLKKEGVITGSALLIDLSKIGGLHPCSIEIENIKEKQAQKVTELLQERAIILVKSETTGKSDLGFFFIAKGVLDLDNLRSVLRKYSESGKINVACWTNPYYMHEKILENVL